MRLTRGLPLLTLLAFLPLAAEQPDCCAGKAEGADTAKALCPKTQTKAEASKAAAKKSARKNAATATSGSSNMVVTRDPATGELHNATPEERAKLFAGRAPEVAAPASRVVVLPDGTEMVQLGEDSMSYAVATKNPDGSITQSCVQGDKAAKAATAAPETTERARSPR